MVLPERKIESLQQFIERFPEVEKVLLDRTECLVQCPKDAEKQQENYSGKKKRHTRKHIAATTCQKRVLVLTIVRGGRIHDKQQLDEANLVSNILDQVAVGGDLGFQGLQNEFINIFLPHKKLRGRELSKEKKQENKEFSRERVKCEHAFAGIKRYNAVSAIYRNRVSDFDDRLMVTAAWLWNFYLDAA